jgi:hypothetical protein
VLIAHTADEYHYFQLLTYSQAARQPEVQDDQLHCTHRQAHDASWGTVAKCASHPAWKSGCQADGKCVFLPYVDEWQLGGAAANTHAKWNRLDGKKLVRSSGSWTEAYDVAAVPSLHQCALLAAGVPTINSFNYDSVAKTCQLLSGIEAGAGTDNGAILEDVAGYDPLGTYIDTTNVDANGDDVTITGAGSSFVEFFVPYELPAEHNHGACTHVPGAEHVENFDTSASGTIATCLATTAES